MAKHLVICIVSFAVGYLSSFYGLKHTMLMRVPVMVVFLLMLYSMDSTRIPLALMALAGGLQSALYWIPPHSLFARNSKSDQMGSDVGKLYSLPKIASIIAPLLGGAITIYFGFSVLFMIAIALLLLSLIPLFCTREIKPHVNFQLKRGVKLFKKYPLYFLGVGVNHLGGMTESVIWPIFVYLTLSSTFSIGLIGSLLGAGTILFAILTGNLSDKFNKKRIIKIGAFFMMLTWILRMFAGNAIYIYFLTISAGFFTVLTLIPFTSITYNLAKKDGIDEFIIFREIPVAVGRTLILALGLLLVSKLQFTFLISGILQILLFFF